jgi:hypothetical protein
MRRTLIASIAAACLLVCAQTCQAGTLRGWTECEYADATTDCNLCVNNFLFAINSMRQFGEPIGFHMRGYEVSASYHIQSIQRLTAPYQDYMILPSSSGILDPVFGDFFIVRFESRCMGRDGERFRSNRLGPFDFEETEPDLDDGVVHYEEIITPNDTAYCHPGGLQVIGRRVVIAMEDWDPLWAESQPWMNNRYPATLVVYNLADNTDPEHPILERLIHLEQNTVQCVFGGKLSNGRYLLGAKEGDELELLITEGTELSPQMNLALTDRWDASSLQSDITRWNAVTPSIAEDLTGVWAGREDVLFAVGRGGRAVRITSSKAHPESLMFKSGSGETDVDLYGVWGSSADNAFAVGAGGTVTRYNGGRWSTMESPTDKDLRAVWGIPNDDILAVGSGGTIIRYDRNRWSIMESPTDKDLHAIWGVSRDSVFAVGDGGTIIAYNGGTWTAVKSPTEMDLRGIWGSSGEGIFIVGKNGTILNYTPTGGWTPIASGTSADLSSVWGSSHENVFAVGDGGEIIHYDGNRWRSMKTPDGGHVNLAAVGGRLPGRVIAVGGGGTILDYTLTWNDYQNMNMITQCEDGQLYVIGMYGDLVGGEDWMDIFQLDIDDATYDATLTLVAQRHFYCSYGGMSDQANFKKSAGMYVDRERRLVLYATNGDNDGPEATLCGLEFRSQYHATSIPGPPGDPWDVAPVYSDGWVELYEGDNEETRSLMIDFDDRLREDYRYLADVEDFDNKASYARWCLPVGVRCILYQNADFGGSSLVLAGTGDFEYSSLGGFDNQASSLRFEYLINGTWTPVDVSFPFHVDEGAISDGENCNGPVDFFQGHLIAADSYVPESATLTVYESSKVRFNGGKKITAYGTLNALGGSTIFGPTKFTAYADTSRGLTAAGQLIMRNGGEIKIH